MSCIVEKVKTDKFFMRYIKFGAGEKTAVILPGLSVKSVIESAESIESAYRALSENYTVYLFERRNDCPETYLIEDMANDTAEALNILGIKNAYIFGVSQGGMIAQCIALNRPDLVYKLALCSTVPKVTEENFRVINEWIEYAERRDEDALNKSICGTVYSDEFNKQYGKVALQFLSGVTDEDLSRFLILAEGCRGFDVSERLKEIKCPVFVSASKADKIFDYRETVLIAEKTDAELYLYENYSHALYDEAPDFLGRLIKFFEK